MCRHKAINGNSLVASPPPLCLDYHMMGAAVVVSAPLSAQTKSDSSRAIAVIRVRTN
jgi:hypothetical protein